MSDIKMLDQSVLLGQFVGMGQLLFSSCSNKQSASVYTQEMLTAFLADVEKHLPLYLETLDELKKMKKNETQERLFVELDKLYLLISCQSFKNITICEECFLKGYQDQMEQFSL